MTHRRPEFGETRDDRERVAQALGIGGQDLRADLPIQLVSTGVPYLYVPIRSMEAIGRCRPNQSALRDLYDGGETHGLLMFTAETATPEARLHARMFTPDAGDRPEDPATGSAAAPLGAYAARYGLISAAPEVRFICEQGIEMLRPSQIHIEVRREGEAITGLRIGGQAVIVGEGTISWS
jgi:trans-2,3-dihydro-3-hydroxyanthranilate isomerase